MNPTEPTEQRRGQLDRVTHSSSSPSLARQAWIESGGNPERAIELLFARLKSQRSLFLKLLREHCANQVAGIMGDERRAAFYGQSPSPPATVSRLRATFRMALMDFPLPVTGKRLAEATGDEVADAARHYRVHEADARRKARWLESVAARAGNSIVAEALDEATLQILRREADVH